jgi:predicted nucleic acid-binding protein
MVLVDTSVWIDYYAGIRSPQTDWLDESVGRVTIGLTDLHLTEFLQGIRDERHPDIYLRSLSEFLILTTGGRSLAVASATNYRLLRKRGITIRKTIDCLIATFCLLEGHSLLHNDRDFEPFEKYLGLKVVHPKAG